jgi:glutamate 5-kinase
VRIPCIITAGDIKDVLVRLVAGAKIGTYFTEKKEKILDGDSEHEYIRSHFKNSKSS